MFIRFVPPPSPMTKRLPESRWRSAAACASSRASCAKARITPGPKRARSVVCAIAPNSGMFSPEFQTRSKPASSARRASAAFSVSSE
jgi:hypothetical protein